MGDLHPLFFIHSVTESGIWIEKVKNGSTFPLFRWKWWWKERRRNRKWRGRLTKRIRERGKDQRYFEPQKETFKKGFICVAYICYTVDPGSQVGMLNCRAPFWSYTDRRDIYKFVRKHLQNIQSDTLRQKHKEMIFNMSSERYSILCLIGITKVGLQIKQIIRSCR